MPKLTIDGKEVQFEGKKMIIQAAIDGGAEIPHYCYHPGLSIVASCRICLAEVETVDPKTGKLSMIPKLVPTCQTPASDGMVVHTKTPKSIANQKAVMEFLLINHPLDCPVCDQAGECHLQDYSYKYGRAESRFQEDKIKQPKKDIGPNVYLYSDRCIMCTRCVRFTKEVSGTSELGVFGRGSGEQIDVFPGRPLDNEVSGNVVDICPVGALLDKDFLFTQRVWFLTNSPSIDGLTASGDNISVHHNDGKIYRVKPRSNKDVNKWWISDEVRYGWKFIQGETRIRQPKRQQYGTQVDTDWNKAYEEARAGIRAAVTAGKRVALMLSPMITCEDAYHLIKAVRAIDPQAILGLGPVPTHGENKTFPPNKPDGFTVYAEKAPNARGVRRVLETFVGAGNVVESAKFIESVKDAGSNVGAVILTGNYPSDWVTKDLLDCLSKKFVVAIDTLENKLTQQAAIVLPASTWVEKAGTFENAKNRLQSFPAALMPAEFTKPEAQIGLDLAAGFGHTTPTIYCDKSTRAALGGVFTTEVHEPQPEKLEEADMEYVEL